MAGDGFPVVCERDDLAALGGLGEIGVGIPQGVGAGVSGVPSAVSAAEISSMECPAARSSRIRRRAASLPGAVRAGLASGEELSCAGAEVPHRRHQGGRGVTEPGGGLGSGQSLGEVGAQCLISAVGRAVRAEEELPAGPRGMLRGFR